MPAPILHLGATVMCSHAGTALPTSPFPRVMVSKQPVVTIAVPYTVAGCALASGSSPPCVTGQFIVGAARVKAGGVPVATLMSSSICTPTGSPLMPIAAQPRVLAT
ncbi:MAG: hypothetical protein IV105_23245 [Rhizobacter sp.]|nr:hypothetical protein [Rhizobacter sp.]